jgi:hypothetical protein
MGAAAKFLAIAILVLCAFIAFQSWAANELIAANRRQRVIIEALQGQICNLEAQLKGSRTTTTPAKADNEDDPTNSKTLTWSEPKINIIPDDGAQPPGP